MEFFNDMETGLKILWIVALISSLIFAFQTVMTFVGSDATDGLNADFDSNFDSADSPFQLFSFRNLVNFLLGFSWAGISFYHTLENKLLLALISFAIGLFFVYLFFLIIAQVQKLAEDNSFRIEETINKTAEVYLTIPAARAGKGKIMISIRGSFHEIDCITDKEKIESGAAVRVVRIDHNLPVVERL